MWEALGHAGALAYEPWPGYDEALTRDGTIEVPGMPKEDPLSAIGHGVSRNGQFSSAATASISISASEMARFEICTSVLAGGLAPKNSERTSPYASR